MDNTLSDFIHVPSDFLKMSDDFHKFILTEHIEDFISILKTKIIAKQGASDYVLNGNETVELIEELSGDALNVKGVSE